MRTDKIAALTIMVTIMVMAALATIPFATAWTNDGQLHYECLHRGERMVIYECDHDLCIVCQKNGWAYLPSRCSGQTLSCGQGPNADIQPPEITLNSPQEGFFYSSRAVPFDITTDEPATYYYMERGKEAKGYLRICPNCRSYSREISFDDGPHFITIKASDTGGNSAYKNVTFAVDSKNPIIRDTLPDSGKYTNGEFTVFYDEENLMKATLFYKINSGAYISISRTDCPKGLRKDCTIKVSSLPDGDVTYYFKIEDSATSVSSTEKAARVDTVPPVLNRIGPQNMAYPTVNVPFEIQVSEPVQLTYIDLFDPRLTKTLCAGCASHKSTQRFSDGSHKVLITATDPAGNKAESTIDFAVDSIAPRIRTMNPADRGYGNGIFDIDYDEANVQKITLHYSQSIEKTVEKKNCESGTLKSCKFNLAEMGITDLKQGPLTYYFTIEDLATTVQSKAYTVTVDTVAPDINMISPQAGPYASKYVDFDIKSSEAVTLEYIDNSDTRPRYKQLCRKCEGYSKRVNFQDGSHTIVLRATDGAGNVKNATMNFLVDSKEPKIKKMLPQHRKYANGNFTITVDEENLQSVTLYYLENGTTSYKSKTVDGSKCAAAGRYKKCEVMQLTKQGPMKYYFEVADIATSVQSKTFDVTVDTKRPEMKINKPDQPTYLSRIVQFNITIGEPVTLEYQDSGSRFTRLCSKCTAYERSRSFGYGPHNLLLRATDAAGNTDEETLIFEITSQ
ncbi:MAG: hypothetical protein ABIF10_02280 [Candidatus Woesearchaeota archaeon]